MIVRVTAIGALYITLVCLLPEILIGYYGIPFYLGGTSILIVVSVTMDTVTAIQSHLVMPSVRRPHPQDAVAAGAGPRRPIPGGG